MRHFIRDDVTVPLRQHNVFFLVKSGLYKNKLQALALNPFIPTVPTCAVRETACLGIMGEPRVPPLNPSESIVLSEHYRL